jgi:ring-1,2-phenylacetyl-CoA epoxidase subunit PaaC
VTEPLVQALLALGDDEFILGHRNSEWAGHAPILEEDIAFANIALDELGHAQLWYGLAGQLTGVEPNRLAFFREPGEFLCVQLVEFPKGDWAFTIVRQYLFDAAELEHLDRLTASSDSRVAEIAAKIRPEEIYHYRHTSNWIKRLALGTAESYRRTQGALNKLWEHALQLFGAMPGDESLVKLGILPPRAELQAAWLDRVASHLSSSGLVVPAARTASVLSRRKHTEYLGPLVTEMQEVARSEAFEVEW